MAHPDFQTRKGPRKIEDEFERGCQYIETIGYKSWQFIFFLYIGVQEKRKLREGKEGKT